MESPSSVAFSSLFMAHCAQALSLLGCQAAYQTAPFVAQPSVMHSYFLSTSADFRHQSKVFACPKAWGAYTLKVQCSNLEQGCLPVM